MGDKRGRTSIATFDPASPYNHINVMIPGQKSDVVFLRKLSRLDHIATLSFYLLRSLEINNKYVSRSEIAKDCAKYIITHFEAKTLKTNSPNLWLSINRTLNILINKNLVTFTEVVGTDLLFKITEFGREELSHITEYIGKLDDNSLAVSSFRVTNNEIGIDKERFKIRIANDIYARIVFSCVNSVYVSSEKHFKQGSTVKMLLISQNRCILSPSGLLVRYILEGGRNTRALPDLAPNYEYKIKEYYKILISLGFIKIVEEKIVDPDMNKLRSLLKMAEVTKHVINRILVGMMEETTKLREQFNLQHVHKRDELIKLGFNPEKSFNQLAIKFFIPKNSNEISILNIPIFNNTIDNILRDFNWHEMFMSSLNFKKSSDPIQILDNKLKLRPQFPEPENGSTKLNKNGIKKDETEIDTNLALNNDVLSKLLSELAEQRRIVNKLISEKNSPSLTSLVPLIKEKTKKEVKIQVKKLKLDKTKSVSERLIETLKSSLIKGLSLNEILLLSGMRGNKVLTDLNKLVSDKKIKKVKIVKNKEFQFYRYKILS